jgi:uncharacterized membrane protein
VVYHRTISKFQKGKLSNKRESTKKYFVLFVVIGIIFGVILIAIFIHNLINQDWTIYVLFTALWLIGLVIVFVIYGRRMRNAFSTLNVLSNDMKRWRYVRTQQQQQQQQLFFLFFGSFHVFTQCILPPSSFLQLNQFLISQLGGLSLYTVVGIVFLGVLAMDIRDHQYFILRMTIWRLIEISMANSLPYYLGPGKEPSSTVKDTSATEPKASGSGTTDQP